MAFRNTAVVKVIVAWDTVNNVYKTGDSANITTRGVGDGAEFTPAAPNVTEIDSTNLPGRYSVALAAGENNYHTVALGGKSSTSGIAIFGPQWDNEMNANVAQLLGTAWLTPGTAGTPDVNAKQVGGTPQTGADVGGMVADTVADLDELITTVGTPAGASIAADIAEIEAETDDIAPIKTQTDKLAFTVANQVDANVLDWKSAVAPAMTGDAFARIGAAGVGLSAIPDEAGVTTLLARLTALRAGYLDNLSAGAVALASGVIVTTNNDKTGYTLSAAGQQAAADAFLARNVAGGSNSGRTVSQAIQTLRNKQAIVAGVYTCYATDDTTPLFEANVTTAAGNPMSAWAPTT